VGEGAVSKSYFLMPFLVGHTRRARRLSYLIEGAVRCPAKSVNLFLSFGSEPHSACVYRLPMTAVSTRHAAMACRRRRAACKRAMPCGMRLDGRQRRTTPEVIE
jgi:hypothetical protein